MKTRAWLELIRFPGVFTANADIVAGFFIGGGTRTDIRELLLLLLASSCLFSAGMALNDFCDHQIDKEERPGRPIPSGRIGRSEALGLVIGLMVCGLVFSFMASLNSFFIAVLLVCMIVLYDGYTKSKSYIGPLNMGACRYLNLLLGLSATPLSLGNFAIPLVTWVYIFGITVLSQHEVSVETNDTGKPPIWTGVIAIVGGVVVFYGVLFGIGVLPNTVGLALCLLFGALLAMRLTPLTKESTPSDIQKTIKQLLLSLIVLDGILVAGGASFYKAIVVWLLIIPTIVVAKRFYMT